MDDCNVLLFCFGMFVVIGVELCEDIVDGLFD